MLMPRKRLAASASSHSALTRRRKPLLTGAIRRETNQVRGGFLVRKEGRRGKKGKSFQGIYTFP